MRALVFSGDTWHPTHIVRTGLEELEDSGFQFDWIDRADERSVEQMSEYPLVILAKANHVSETDERLWVTDKIEKSFLDHVRQGSGLLVIHSGLVGYEQMSVLRGLVGGAFVGHPDQCPVTVDLKDGHPFTRGSISFTLTDEHYFVTVDDPQADIFMTTSSEHGVQPGGWTRTEGDGRVCVMTPSHNEEGWVHPSFRRLLLNALHWCGRS